MYQSFLLSEQDAAALRAALATPLFSSLHNLVPGIGHALAHPQPDFGPYLPLVSDAISEVRSNTNYPEDWDELSDAEDAAYKARKAFFQALPAAEPADKAGQPAPLPTFYVLVQERMGSNDGAAFGKHVFTDFDAACKALKARAEAECAECPDDEGFSLDEYGSPEHGTYGINLLSGGTSVCSQYFLEKFTLAPTAGGVMGGAA